MQLLGAAIFTPIVTWVARRLVLASGDVVVSNYDIAGFVLTLPGIAFVLVVAALAVSLLLAEFAGLGWIAGHAMARRRITAASTIAFVLRRLPILVGLSTRLFIGLVLLAVPFLAAVTLVWFMMLAGHDINYYLAVKPPEWRRVELIVLLLMVVYALLAAWRLAGGLYALPILTLGNATPAQALATSKVMTHGRILRIVWPLVLWWLLLTATAAAITWACRLLSDAGLDWAGVDVHRVLPLVAIYVTFALLGGFAYGALGLAGHQFLVTRIYGEQVDAGRWHAPAATEIDHERSRGIARPAMIAAPALFVLALGTAWFLFSKLDLKTDVAITAHRGASIEAPENSLAAFRAAIEAGATYAELDVQHTLDRQIVVVHDSDLLRMGGDPRKVAMLTAAEIAKIDIGSKADPRFAGEHPPTLGEVIDLVRGRMKLNIELKYNVPDSDLAPAVVELLRQNDFLDQAVITSLDYEALKQVKRLEPRLETGHIVTAAVGDIVRTEADFLSLNAARVTEPLLRRAHAAGKEVHVWTVNTPEMMLRMIELGVDNIITDDPARLAQVMRARNALTAPEMLGLRLRVLFAAPPREVIDPGTMELL